MKYFNIIKIVIFFLLTSNYQKNYAQDGWENIVDTIKIEEAQVVDSAILNILDSAFTFLRLPPLEFGEYSYELNFYKEEPDPSGNIYFRVALFVEEYMSKELDIDDYSPDTDGKLLLNYKGKQIRIGYNVEINDTLALQYFKPTGTKINFYRYLKIDRKLPNAVFFPERRIVQSVWFFGTKGYIIFREYQLNIYPFVIIH